MQNQKNDKISLLNPDLSSDSDFIMVSKINKSQILELLEKIRNVDLIFTIVNRQFDGIYIPRLQKSERAHLKKIVPLNSILVKPPDNKESDLCINPTLLRQF